MNAVGDTLRAGQRIKGGTRILTALAKRSTAGASVTDLGSICQMHRLDVTASLRLLELRGDVAEIGNGQWNASLQGLRRVSDRRTAAQRALRKLRGRDD